MTVLLEGEKSLKQFNPSDGVLKMLPQLYCASSGPGVLVVLQLWFFLNYRSLYGYRHLH